MEVILADAYGFCMGAKRAIEIAKKTRENNNGPVAVLKEIVHNPYVVNQLKKNGIYSVNSMQKIRKGTIIFSAHGVGPNIIEEARKKKLNIVDATCPLVAKVHNLVKLLSRKGYTIILLGNKFHDEVIGVKNEAPKNIRIISKKEDIGKLRIHSDRLALVTQTTLSVDDTKEMIGILKIKFPNIEIYNTICDATQRRQNAVKELSKKVDLILVIGSKKSSNSRKLVDIASRCGKKSYLMNNEKDIKPRWMKNIKRVGITAGASTPDEIIEKIVEKVKRNDYGKEN